MTARVLLAAALLAALLPFSAVAAEPPPSAHRPGFRTTVLLVRLGGFPKELAAAVEQRLRGEYQVDVRRLDDVPLPASAYYPPRKRYRADKLLDFLETLAKDAPPGTRVLGLTDVDISTTKGPYADWGVFGLGELGRRNCVVSMFRLKRGARSTDHLAFRVVSTAVHEVGHTLGLPHCPTARCVMQDAEGSVHNTDNGTGHVCEVCRRTIDRLVPVRP